MYGLRFTCYSNFVIYCRGSKKSCLFKIRYVNVDLITTSKRINKMPRSGKITTIIPGNSNSTATIGISETIRDTRMVKLGQSCVFRCLAMCRLESLKIRSISEDIRKKRKFAKTVFIFSWLYLKETFKISSTFTLPLFPRYPMVFSDLPSDVSSFGHHHQLCFFKYGPGFFITDFKSF